jgi:hypothetical protein
MLSSRRPLLAATALLLLTGCGSATASLSPAAAPPTVPPDLAGHQYDVPDADRVLVAGDSVDLDLPAGKVRLTVNGPALQLTKPFRPGVLHDYLATFTVTAQVLSGMAVVLPADFRLLAIADQVDGGAKVTTSATVSTLARTVASTGRTLVGTWSAPFVEGHGELLYTPPGASRPAALWDFRAES